MFYQQATFLYYQCTLVTLFKYVITVYVSNVTELSFKRKMLYYLSEYHIISAFLRIHQYLLCYIIFRQILHVIQFLNFLTVYFTPTSNYYYLVFLQFTVLDFSVLLFNNRSNFSLTRTTQVK